MAQVLITDQQANAESLTMWVRTIVLGALLGILFWLLTILIGHYIIEPLYCRNMVNAALCNNSTPLSGNIAAVLVALAGVIAMVRIGAARPIVIAVATAALLWDLASWTQGVFWLEAVLFSVVLYAITFALFAWITRYASLLVTLIITVLIVIIIRIALVL